MEFGRNHKMAEFLVLAVTKVTLPDPDEDRANAHKKGDIVVVADNNHSWGSLETLPNFVKVKCAEALLADYNHNGFPWFLVIDYEVLSHDTATDIYNIRAFSVVPGAANEAGLTREMIENHLTAWNASIISVTANEVVFDLFIWPAITSNRFWDKDVSQIIFTQLTYDEPTNEHHVRADYSTNGWNQSKVEIRIIELGGYDVVFNSPTEVEFRILGTSVRAEFKRDMTEALSKLFKRRRYGFSEAHVDQAISSGGIMTVTKTQLDNVLIDHAT